MAKSIADQTKAIQKEFESRPEGLQKHVRRVLDEALDLGRHYDVDPERIELAVWGHDLFRAHKPEELLRLSREAGIPISEEDEAAPIMLYGPLGAAVMADRFKVTDDEALAAVRDHTAGLAAMSLLAKIVLLSDKVEKRKRTRTPAMEAIRRVARRDLDLALLTWADWKWVDERRNGYASYTQHWEARLVWVAHHHAEIGLPGRIPVWQFDID